MQYHDKTYRIPSEYLPAFAKDMADSIRGFFLILPSLSPYDLARLDKAIADMNTDVKRWGDGDTLGTRITLFQFSHDDRESAGCTISIELGICEGELTLQAYVNQSGRWLTPDQVRDSALRLLLIAGGLSGVTYTFDKMGSKYEGA
jgi:hypothetical protein